MEAATEKQIATIKKALEAQGVPKPELTGIDKQDASNLISMLFAGKPEEVEMIVRRFTTKSKDQPQEPEKQATQTPVNNAPVIQPNKYELIVDGKWKSDQIQLIHDTVAKGTTDQEFELFLYQAWRLELDPLTKEIWCVKYGNEPAAIFASFSGIQKKAMESGEWDGYEISMNPPILKEGEFPESITCTMYRKGVSHPVVFTARWAEFARYKKDGSLQSNWAGMPTVMLRKCAISNAIRQAFPDHVGSIYTPEEMPNGQQ